LFDRHSGAAHRAEPGILFLQLEIPALALRAMPE
jgi:hypothetical protein